MEYRSVGNEKKYFLEGKKDHFLEIQKHTSIYISGSQEYFFVHLLANSLIEFRNEILVILKILQTCKQEQFPKIKYLELFVFDLIISNLFCSTLLYC